MRLFSNNFETQKYKKVNVFLKRAAAAFYKSAAGSSTSGVRPKNAFLSAKDLL